VPKNQSSSSSQFAQVNLTYGPNVSLRASNLNCIQSRRSSERLSIFFSIFRSSLHRTYSANRKARRSEVVGKAVHKRRHRSEERDLLVGNQERYYVYQIRLSISWNHSVGKA